MMQLDVGLQPLVSITRLTGIQPDSGTCAHMWLRARAFTRVRQLLRAVATIANANVAAREARSLGMPGYM